MAAELSKTMETAASGWLTRQQAARYAAVSVRTLSRWTIATSKIGRTVRYRREDIDAFLTSHRIEPVKSRIAKLTKRYSVRRPTATNSSFATELMGMLKS